MRIKSNLKAGLILSYVLLVFNTFYGFFITPYILKYVGVGNYGVYKSVAALSSSLAVLDFGLGSTMTRYMAKYNATKDKKAAGNFASMIFIQFFIIAILIISVGSWFYFSLDKMYGATFSSDELILAKRLLFFLLLNMVLRLFENLLSGIAHGHERFVFTNGIKVVSAVLKFSLILIILPIVKNVLLIVCLETAIVTVAIIIFITYVICKLHIIPRLTNWNWKVFKESFGYTVLMFVQTLTIQFNGNIDNVLIGARINSAAVTVYSMALIVFGMYENLSGSIANIMLPKMTKKILNGSGADELQASVEKAGYFQFIILAAALGGFAVLGKQFYNVWLGETFSDCYYLTLILIVPVTIPMIQNVCLSILRAENKMLYRTVTLAISCVINAVFTLIGINIAGYWGAAFGTSCATISNIIFMNIYYKKVLGFKILRMFKNIIGKTVTFASIASALTFVLSRYIHGGWVSFVISALFFMLVYLIPMYKWGIKAEYRSFLNMKVKK